MGVGAVSGISASGVYTGYSAEQQVKAAEQSSSKETEKAAEQGVVYEKSESTNNAAKSATYSVNKMSKSDRDQLVQKLKADQASREQSLVSIVRKMMDKQAKSYGTATGNDSIWRFLASGNYTVDAATKAQAQKDIAEDGYWGVKQTSQRLFDFASALAGDDVEKMKKMQAAMEKGYKMATKSWGKELPSISKQTIDAANKLFEDYYASKESVA